MIFCDHCSAEFEVVLESTYSEAEVKFCPCCGEMLVKELDFENE